MRKLVAALAKTVLGRIADAGGGKDSFLVGHGGKIVISYPLLIRRSAIRKKFTRRGGHSEIVYRFFFTQAPTRSSAFSMFSIELATLKRK
jgi:hypothetical protein